MVKPKPIQTTVSSTAKDVLMTCGADHPALYIESEQIVPFIEEPTNKHLRVLSGYGVALATLMSATTDHFSLLPTTDVPVKNLLAKATLIQFTTPGDLRILYTNDPIITHQKQWLQARGINMIVTPHAFGYLSKTLRGIQTLSNLWRNFAYWNADVKQQKIVPTATITLELAEIATALKQTLGKATK